MSATAVLNYAFEVSDATGQKVLSISDLPDSSTVGDVMPSVIAKMGLPAIDRENRQVTYHPRLDREGRHLLGSERVADAVQPGDRVVLQPNVDAGGRSWTLAIG